MFVVRALPVIASLTLVGIGSAVVPPSPAQRLGIGLEWFKYGPDGFSCVSCHTPSGRDLVDSAITREDLVRRGSGHIGEKDATALADSILRSRGRLPRPATTVRPFQPEGTPLKGNTPEQRDTSFGGTLNNLSPTLAAGKVTSLADARKAAAELTDDPLQHVVPGIVFDPLSQEPFRKMDGPPLGDWIPDIGLSYEGTTQFVISLDDHPYRDGYDILAIDTEINKVEGRFKSGIDMLSRWKRMALVQYEGFLRSGKLPKPSKLSPSLNANPIWLVGDFARANTGSTPLSIGMTEFAAEKQGLDPEAPMDLHPMAVSWFWTSWIIDPSLQSTALSPQVKSGRRMTEELLDGGPLFWHAAYFNARRPMEELAETKKITVELSALARKIPARLPADPADRARLVRYLDNLFRMLCLTVEADPASVNRATAIPPDEELDLFLERVSPLLSPQDRDETAVLHKRAVQALKKPN